MKLLDDKQLEALNDFYNPKPVTTEKDDCECDDLWDSDLCRHCDQDKIRANFKPDFLGDKELHLRLFNRLSQQKKEEFVRRLCIGDTPTVHYTGWRSYDVGLLGCIKCITATPSERAKVLFDMIPTPAESTPNEQEQ